MLVLIPPVRSRPSSRRTQAHFQRFSPHRLPNRSSQVQATRQYFQSRLKGPLVAPEAKTLHLEKLVFSPPYSAPSHSEASARPLPNPPSHPLCRLRLQSQSAAL